MPQFSLRIAPLHAKDLALEKATYDSGQHGAQKWLPIASRKRIRTQILPHVSV
jgi:hypothetical protein